MKNEIKAFGYDSPEYRKALVLRYHILRKPLSLQFTEAELKKDQDDIHLGLFEGESIRACLTLAKAEEGKMKMRQVAVDAPFQGKGLGKKLSKAAEKYAKGHGFKVMFCNARKEAVRFYEKMGYRVVSDEFTEVNIPHFTMEKQL
jgi:predicted GNAT family N-acyltransferase